MIEMNEQEIQLVSGGADIPGYPSAPPPAPGLSLEDPSSPPDDPRFYIA